MTATATTNGNHAPTSTSTSPDTQTVSRDQIATKATPSVTEHTGTTVPDSEKLDFKGRVLASLTLLLWLNLFAGGIFIDTKPSRCAISPGGVIALERQASGNTVVNVNPCADHLDSTGRLKSGREPYVSWFIAIVFFLPLNLALLCAMAGVLGTFGNNANLSTDPDKPSRDKTNPHISGLLRGFFVFLCISSGVFVFDEAPFSNTSPTQYMRLAGFLSLLSFIVSYQPTIFKGLIAFAQDKVPHGKSATVLKAEDKDGKSEAVLKGQQGDAEFTMRGDVVTVTNSREGTTSKPAETAEGK